MKKTKEPIVLTVNGKAAVVVQDAESYQSQLDLKERSETIAVLRQRFSIRSRQHLARDRQVVWA
jgi:prevent-host-death family protein